MRRLTADSSLYDEYGCPVVVWMSSLYDEYGCPAHADILLGSPQGSAAQWATDTGPQTQFLTPPVCFAVCWTAGPGQSDVQQL